ncbi:MAG: hypothetical protein ACRCXZ_00790 [Patescibacteria group bacterium]
MNYYESIDGIVLENILPRLLHVSESKTEQSPKVNTISYQLGYELYKTALELYLLTPARFLSENGLPKVYNQDFATALAQAVVYLLVIIARLETSIDSELFEARHILNHLLKKYLGSDIEYFDEMLAIVRHRIDSIYSANRQSMPEVTKRSVLDVFYSLEV